MNKRSIASIVSSFVATVAFAIPAHAGHEVMLEQVPAAVRDTIQKEVKDGKLGTIELESEKGEPAVYEVEFTSAAGEEFELKIDEEGKLLESKQD